jgi:hypothetical protein
MSTKIRVETLSSDNLEDWDYPLLDNDDVNKNRKRGVYDGEHRKKIDDFIEERRLKQHIVHDYSFDSKSH